MEEIFPRPNLSDENMGRLLEVQKFSRWSLYRYQHNTFLYSQSYFYMVIRRGCDMHVIHKKVVEATINPPFVIAYEQKATTHSKK